MHSVRETGRKPLMSGAEIRRRRCEFAKLDGHIRNKIAEIERKAEEGGLAYEMAVRACNRAERRKN